MAANKIDPSCGTPQVVFLAGLPICQQLLIQLPKDKFVKNTVGDLHNVDAKQNFESIRQLLWKWRGWLGAHVWGHFLDLSGY